jgi:hypothetical protein
MSKKIPFINSLEGLNSFSNIDTFCQYLKSPLVPLHFFHTIVRSGTLIDISD